MKRVLLSGSFLMLLVACGGAVAPTGDPSNGAGASNDGTSNDGTSSAGGGGSSGSGGSSSAGGGSTGSGSENGYLGDPVECKDGASLPPSSDCGCGKVCVEGEWRCPRGCGADDSGDHPGAFACGDLTCDGTTSFCRHFTGGPMMPDGGIASSYDCVSFADVGCASSHSCGCVMKSTGGTWCNDDGGDVTEEIDAP